MPRIFFSFLLLLPFVTLGQQHAVTAYQQEIAQHRAQEDSVFQYSGKSPLTPEAKATFKGLAYFPVQEAYKVKARFVRTAQEGVFKMPTTGTRTPEYVKYGELHFLLQGQPLRLNVYQNQELMKQVQYANYLFIPFTDATTGYETYATGRYLDFSIPMMGQDSVWVDFNKAYNPSCAYSDGYSCPIPPKENKLPVRVEAGVKTYEKKDDKQQEAYSESLPEYPGGQQAMFKFISKNLKVPGSVEKAGIEGKEVISFVVGRDGTISDVESISSLHPDLFAETVRVMYIMPRWKPGQQNGREVSVRYSMPIYVFYKKRGKPKKDTK
jgi:uncharacterized protein (DUF1684 family)